MQYRPVSFIGCSGKRALGRASLADAIRDWTQAGLAPQDFLTLPDWALVPAFEGAVNRDRTEWQRAAYQAWHSGVLARPLKNTPKLDAMMQAFEPKRASTADEIARALRDMARQSDGKE